MPRARVLQGKAVAAPQASYRIAALASDHPSNPLKLSCRLCVIGSVAGPSCFSVLAEQVNVDVAGMLARAAKAQGVKNFVHVSALAADPDSPSRWAQTKVLRATFGARRVQDL